MSHNPTVFVRPHLQQHSQQNAQRGVALLYVLLIFLLITTVASRIVTNLWLHTVKNTHYLERIQAKQYALGAEQYVALLLETDHQQDKQRNRLVDHLGEGWNVNTVDYELEQGSVVLKVIDEQGRFNLNGLSQPIKNNNQSTASTNSNPLSMFENLLQAQALDLLLAKSVSDWVGKPQQGAPAPDEDLVYLSLNPPRRMGLANMASISELNLIEGFDATQVEKLAPYITVIPTAPPLNINTAPPEVLQSLSRELTEGDAMLIQLGRQNNGLASMEEINQHVALANTDALLPKGSITFHSQYFSAHIKTTYRDSTFFMKTLFYRNREGRVQVISREVGPSRYWAWEDTNNEP